MKGRKSRRRNKRRKRSLGKWGEVGTNNTVWSMPAMEEPIASQQEK